MPGELCRRRPPGCVGCEVASEVGVSVAGVSLGAAVNASDGTAVIVSVGAGVSTSDGANVGVRVGARVNTSDGACEGRREGRRAGLRTWRRVGWPVETAPVFTIIFSALTVPIRMLMVDDLPTGKSVLDARAILAGPSFASASCFAPLPENVPGKSVLDVRAILAGPSFEPTSCFAPFLAFGLDPFLAGPGLLFFSSREKNIAWMRAVGARLRGREGRGVEFGARVGTVVGSRVGRFVGRLVGSSVGSSVGSRVGLSLGSVDGLSVGRAVGRAEARFDGAGERRVTCVGFSLPWPLDGGGDRKRRVGERVGLRVGLAVGARVI